MSSTALLVIEGLWWTPEQKPKRPSVLLFLKDWKITGVILTYIMRTFMKKPGSAGRLKMI
jgi:hypothetical protein